MRNSFAYPLKTYPRGRYGGVCGINVWKGYELRKNLETQIRNTENDFYFLGRNPTTCTRPCDCYGKKKGHQSKWSLSHLIEKKIHI